MFNLTNLKLAKRLTIGFGSLTLLALSMAFVAWWGISSSNRALHETEIENHKSLVAQSVNGDIDVVVTRVWNIAGSKDAAVKQRLKDELVALRQAYLKKLDELKASAKTELGRQMLGTIETTIASLREVNNRVIELSLSGKESEAIALYAEEGLKRSEGLSQSIGQFIDWRAKRLAETTRTADALAKKARWVIMGASLVVVVLAALFGVLITRSVTGPIEAGVGLLERISKGDLSQEVPESLRSRKDEVGDLARALARLIVVLRSFVLEVVNSNGSLSVMSEELLATSHRLTGEAKGTSDKGNAVATAAEEASANTVSVAASMEQASSNLTAVATATEEMSATIGDIASNTAKARAVSDQAGVEAQAVATLVQHLGHAATDIGKVTETITEISSQTNLLALNATIEAARAGAAGKGFAVVAHEIKELARQTAAATEDIKARISGVQTSTGSAIVGIEKIGGVIKEVSGLVASISAAIEEQATVTKDVAGNVSQASAGVRDANERVAQTATVSKSIAQDIAEISVGSRAISNDSNYLKGHADVLQSLTGRLKQLVGQFDIGETTDFAPIKKGHIQWRNRLVEMFEGRQKVASTEVTDHHHCPLGKWYDGEGQQSKHLPRFRELGAQHQSFHSLVGEIVKLWNGGQPTEAFARFETLMPLTHQLFATMDRLSLDSVSDGAGAEIFGSPASGRSASPTREDLAVSTGSRYSVRSNGKAETHHELTV